jgi:quercetin dioxygenase-like cupin family protein
MTAEEFSTELREQGFCDLVAVDRQPNGALDLHAHPFESRALVLAGEITLVVNHHETLFRAGEVFHLARDTVHAQRNGPSGVRYPLGRK